MSVVRNIMVVGVWYLNVAKVKNTAMQTYVHVTAGICVLALTMSGLFGCLAAEHPSGVKQHDLNLTSDQSRWAESGFTQGAIFETTTDLFLDNNVVLMDILIRVYGPGLSVAKGEEAKYPDKEFHWVGPTTAARYREDPTLWPAVNGLVDAGTKIRIVELWEHGNKELSPYYRTDVKGVILTGPLSGKKVGLMELEWLHAVERPDHTKVMSAGPDLRLLRPVPGK